MASRRGRLAIFLIYVAAVNQLKLPSVSCQDEISHCLPRKTFFALLRLPEVSSNLAAYSRNVRIIRDDLVSLKSLSSEEGDEVAEICLPAGVYLELFSDPTTRVHLRTQKMLEDPAARVYDPEILDVDDLVSSKRSIATLAKNDDLPISIRGRNEEDDEEIRTMESRQEPLDLLLDTFLAGDHRTKSELVRDYGLPNGEFDMESLGRDYPHGKRNVASLARDFALPSGKRNIAALARDYSLPNGKRNLAALARLYSLPSSGKRNVAALARDYALPNGKRYLGSLARSGDLQLNGLYEEKRNVGSLVRNGDLVRMGKRNVGTLARDWSLPTQNRYGRSLDAKKTKLADRYGSVKQELINLQRLGHQEDQGRKNLDDRTKVGKIMTTATDNKAHTEAKNDSQKIDDVKRPKRQIDYSDEYPLPVMQNTNVLDYEEMIEALTGEYPNTEKRFMGTGPALEVQDDDTDQGGYYGITHPSKRHIGALARLGWLPSFRAARFSRSPRYLVDREDPADGSTSNNSPNASTRTLSLNLGTRGRYLQSLNGDCRHGFKRYFLLPRIDNFLHLRKLQNVPKSA
ncbi:neuropeptide-like 1 isoform X2 [Cephus cinctus]|uniref:Neuropeptide-like 1 isoform X2 n=1 Tax=Cephus cinctus TaxID=211228 RepID=A0AAJ7CFK5_CEPCN|nr:neuropeptide-like 1 isoform X2 [Cephus cinctus]